MAKINWKKFCKNCGGCCGLFPFEKSFFEKFVRLATKPYKIKDYDSFVIAVTDDGYCVFLTTEKRCRIYNDRPEVCRLYGTISGLNCSYLRGEKTDVLAEVLTARETRDKYLT